MSAPYNIQGPDGQWYYLASDNKYYPCAAPQQTYTTEYDHAEAGSFQGDDPNGSNEYDYQYGGSSEPSHGGTSITGNTVWSPGERSRRERKRDAKEKIDNFDTAFKDSKKDKNKDKKKKK